MKNHQAPPRSNPSTPLPKVLLTVPEACGCLGVSRSTLYDLISRGKLPVVKLSSGRSGGVRFRPEDLKRFADDHLVNHNGSQR